MFAFVQSETKETNAVDKIVFTPIVTNLIHWNQMCMPNGVNLLLSDSVKLMAELLPMATV